jgi:hypothetical protein
MLERHIRPPKIVHGMARLAVCRKAESLMVRGAGLHVVINMTDLAVGGLTHKLVLLSRPVASVTVHERMPAKEWKARLLVLQQNTRGLTPVILVVTARAVVPELATMDDVSMTVGAEHTDPMEDQISVAVTALELGVASMQGVVGLRMIEVEFRAKGTPVFRGVAAGAIELEVITVHRGVGKRLRDGILLGLHSTGGRS